MSFKKRKLRTKNKTLSAVKTFFKFLFLKTQNIFSFLKKRFSTKSWKSWIIFYFICIFLTISAYVFILQFDTFDDAIDQVRKTAKGAIDTIKDKTVEAIGDPLEKDKYGKTNILLFGVDKRMSGGADLTDTMMIISVDETNGSVSMFSIPRDLYFSVRKLGNSRVNEIFSITKRYSKTRNKCLQKKGDKRLECDKITEKDGSDELKDAVNKITGLEIHYSVKVSFDTLVELVDELNTITINVPCRIYDDKYPNKNDNGYSPFLIKKGIQIINGERALKYARTRKGTCGGDLNRSKRQHQIISAIKEKAFSLGVLTSPSRVKNLYDVIKKNVYTDFTTKEIITFANVISNIDNEKMNSIVLSNHQNEIGGLLYNPPRDDFNGASVFLPFGSKYNSFDYVHLLAKINMSQSEFKNENSSMKILNSSKISGLANNFAKNLYRFAVIEKKDDKKSKEIYKDIFIGNCDKKDTICNDVDSIKIIVKDCNKNAKTVEILKNFLVKNEFEIDCINENKAKEESSKGETVFSSVNYISKEEKNVEKIDEKVSKIDYDIEIIVGNKYKNPLSL